MTLDEAIKHYDDLADYDCYNDKQLERSKEWFQVAEWLIELKKFKEQQTCDCVDRKAAIDIVKYECCELKGLAKRIVEKFNGLPPTHSKIIKCENCIHNGSFDTDCPIRWPGKEYCSFAEGKEDLDCNSCENQDEVDGSNCYECVKGIHNNYKADREDKK